MVRAGGAPLLFSLFTTQESKYTSKIGIHPKLVLLRLLALLLLRLSPPRPTPNRRCAVAALRKEDAARQSPEANAVMK